MKRLYYFSCIHIFSSNIQNNSLDYKCPKESDLVDDAFWEQVTAICDKCNAQFAAKSQERTKEEKEEDTLVLSWGDASLLLSPWRSRVGEVCEYYVFVMFFFWFHEWEAQIGNSCMEWWGCYRLGDNPWHRTVLPSDFSKFLFHELKKGVRKCCRT